ncbi:MAG: hypothetical protein E5V71_00780 [Mesorhizobium sp.]|nr:MAG: hypothetical protein E5V71_00780 [Mesorhizobium sp.]
MKEDVGCGRQTHGFAFAGQKSNGGSCRSGHQACSMKKASAKRGLKVLYDFSAHHRTCPSIVDASRDDRVRICGCAGYEYHVSFLLSAEIALSRRA